MDDGQRTMGDGQWTMDDGQCTEEGQVVVAGKFCGKM